MPAGYKLQQSSHGSCAVSSRMVQLLVSVVTYSGQEQEAQAELVDRSIHVTGKLKWEFCAQVEPRDRRLRRPLTWLGAVDSLLSLPESLSMWTLMSYWAGQRRAEVFIMESSPCSLNSVTYDAGVTMIGGRGVFAPLDSKSRPPPLILTYLCLVIMFLMGHDVNL